jgi:hypothetical protein
MKMRVSSLRVNASLVLLALVLTSLCYADSEPRVSQTATSLIVKFGKKTYEYKQRQPGSSDPRYTPKGYLRKAGLYLIEIEPSEFGPYYRLVNEKNNIWISGEPKFNPTGDAFVIVQYTEAGDGTYGIDVWRRNASGKWSLKEQFRHKSGPPYLEFVDWVDDDTIRVRADFFDRTGVTVQRTGPHALPIKEVPNTLEYLGLDKNIGRE